MPNENYYDGEELEILTVPGEDGEEIEVVKKEQFESLKFKFDDVIEEHTQTKKELEELNEKIEKMSDKDKNFSNLRKQKQEKENELSEVKNQLVQLSDELKSLKGTSVEDSEERFLNELSDGDENKKKLLKKEYDNFVGSPGNEEEVKQRMLKAAKLIDIEVDNSNFYSGVGLSNYGGSSYSNDNKRFTDTDKGKQALKTLRRGKDDNK